MISQLLGEPYLNVIDPVRGLKKTKIDEQKVYPISFGQIASCLQGHDVNYNFEYNGKILKTREDYEEMIKECPLQELESVLLEDIYIESSDRKTWDTTYWKTLSFNEKVIELGIPEYASDRDLNYLIMYYHLLAMFQND